MNELIIENLGISYQEKEVQTNTSKKNIITNNFSLRVKRGELIVLLGPSGCGKSSLLTAISGLKTPDHGSIRFGDHIFYSKEENILMPAEKRNIGFVFQSYALWPHMNVYQNIAFPLKARGHKKSFIKKRVHDMLEITHMTEYANRYPSDLSGGEKQRIAIARSLAYEPALLLLDEPLANLDAHLKSTLIKEIKELQRQLNLTTIYVTHDQQEAFEIADQIVIMNKGKIMQQGNPMDIYNNSDNLFVAEFIGKNNIINAKEPGFSRFFKQCHRRKNISIRPEDIQISSNGKHTGIIRNIRYRGSYTEYIVVSNDRKLIIHAPDRYSNKIGDTIAFNIHKFHSF